MIAFILGALEAMDRKRKKPKHGDPHYLPDHEEILLACAKIRAGWSEEERMKRAGFNPLSRWTVPNVSLGDCAANLRDDGSLPTRAEP